MKVALGIEYCGRDYFGWQKQNIPKTVQAAVEAAISIVADQNIEVICAGRTDAGVHAIQQVVHFETQAVRKPHSWILGCNSNLPDDIAVTWAKQVEEDFHARFAATNRTYQYVILNRRARPAIFHGKVTWECMPLELERMQQASRCFIGEHDFTSYRAVACQAKSPVRTVNYLHVHRRENWFVITICANAFLHHMVRNIAGVLISIGTGKHEIGWAEQVLKAKDRTAGGVTAPPDGLYLVDVAYPERFEIPKSTTLLEKLGIQI